MMLARKKGGRMARSMRSISLALRTTDFVRNHVMLVVAAALAFFTMIIVPPDGAYLGYFDWNTLGCLFSVLAVANAFRFAGVFDRIARIVIERLSTPTTVVMTLVVITGVFSMVVTNDLALIIMLPITLYALVKAGWGSLIAPVFVLEGLAANLCGIIMPFGNPQNLYLYFFYSIGIVDFLQTMALPFMISAVLVIVCTFVLVRRANAQPAKIDRTGKQPLKLGRILVYLLLLVLSLLAVFRVLPVGIVAAVIFVSVALADVRALKAVDYPLLLTFVCFFIFAGNMARMPYLGELLGGLMEADGLIASAFLSQVISNVPAAVLLSHFAGRWQALLVGVNVGGAGTLVASLASLITLRCFTRARYLFPDLAESRALSKRRFMKFFTYLNFGFLAVLLVVCHFQGV